jgi:hypothetical protein
MQTIPSKAIVNKPGRVMRNAFILTVLMIAGAFITGYSDLNGIDGGYALIVLFGFLALASFVTALVYIPRAKEFDKLLNLLNPLAHWTYTQQEWDSFIKENLKEMISVNKALLRMVIIVSLVVCVILFLMYRHYLPLLIVAVIILMLSIVAFLAPRIRTSILRNGIHEAYIGDKSAYVGGTFQTWAQLGARLVAVDINSESAVPILNITFEFPTLRSTQQEIVRIPVPGGKMEEAKKIADRLSKQLNND